MILSTQNLFKSSSFLKVLAISLLFSGLSNGLVQYPSERAIVGPNGNDELPSSKKGVVGWQYNWSFESYLKALYDSKSSWTYNYNPIDFVKIDQTKCKNVEFVPMIRTVSDLNIDTITQIEKSKAKALLTFNEPDLQSQDNMSPEAVIAQWPALQQLSVRIGSPAPAIGFQKDGWFEKFFKLAMENNLRIDFITVHYYSPYYDDPNKATSELKKFLTNIWKQYKKPIWLTEFALQNFGVSPSPVVTADQQSAFLKEAIPMLEKLPFLERYAFFSLPPGDTEVNQKMTSLSDINGNLNHLGYEFAQLGLGNGTFNSTCDESSIVDATDFVPTILDQLQRWKSSADGISIINTSLLAAVLPLMSLFYLYF